MLQTFHVWLNLCFETKNLLSLNSPEATGSHTKETRRDHIRAKQTFPSLRLHTSFAFFKVGFLLNGYEHDLEIWYLQTKSFRSDNERESKMISGIEKHFTVVTVLWRSILSLTFSTKTKAKKICRSSFPLANYDELEVVTLQMWYFEHNTVHKKCNPVR